MKSDKKLIAGIIKKYGPVIDLRTNPEIMIDILRKHTYNDDGGLPGGVPPSPPPGPTSFQDRITNEDIMKAVLALSRQVKALTKPTVGTVRSVAKVAKVARKAAKKG